MWKRRLVIAFCAGAVIMAATPAHAAIDGAWGYFGKPRAVYARGVTYFGFVSSRGDVGVGAYDVRTGRQRSTILAARFGKDDHNNPSLWIRPDGRIVAFWSPHSGYVLPRGGPSRLYYRISSAPRSIRRFGPTRVIRGNTGDNRLGYTYPSPVYTPVTRTLWLFWRGGHWQPTYARSRDGGRTWSTPRTLLSNGRKVYAVYAGDGAAGFHVAVIHDNPSVSHNSVYYLHYTHGRWQRADGRVVGRLSQAIPLQRGDAIYRRGAHGASNSWVLDVAQDATGRPVVLYRLAGGPDEGYWYAKWSGARWIDHLIARSGKLHGKVKGRRVAGCMGGAAVDHEDPDVVYLSIVKGSSARIDIAQTADEGRDWTFREVPTTSPWPNLRPVSPLGHRHGVAVLWMQGRYRNFVDFDTRIRIWTDPNWPA
jgi:hypothetical protein